MPSVKTTLWLLLAVLTACGNAQLQPASAQSPDRPVVVVTTNILGDVVNNLVGGQFDVVTIMPVGSDPHDFQPSAQDVAALEGASAIIINGAGFEEGLLDPIEAAADRGQPVFEAISVVDTIKLTSAGDDDTDHHEHGDDHDDDGDDHDDDGDDHDDHGHEVGGIDPHFFTDPARMAVVADAIVEFLTANVDGFDPAALRADASLYISMLESLDEEVEKMLAAVPDSRRVLVTNHQVFGYFADSYRFEVVGTVVPTGSSADGVSGRRLAELAELLERQGISVVFADASASAELANTVANEVGDVAVVKLFTESLGNEDSDAATYVDMVRSNARQIAEALAGGQ